MSFFVSGKGTTIYNNLQQFPLSLSSSVAIMSPVPAPGQAPEKQTYSIACMPADGIGPEVIAAGVEVLRTLSDASGAFNLKFKDYDWSSETYKKTGKYIPDGGLEELKKHNAILFGAVGAPGECIQIFGPTRCSTSRHS